VRRSAHKFVCSVGNVPLAAVLWSGGISFAGVMAFIFADLIVLPILVVYRKYYGTTFALRITALMFVTMVLAALVIEVLFNGLGVIPHGARPTRADIFSSIHIDYKLALNVLGLAIFAALFWLTARRGATDLVCGMKVDRAKAITKNFNDRRSTSAPSTASTPSKPTLISTSEALTGRSRRRSPNIRALTPITLTMAEASKPPFHGC